MYIFRKNIESILSKLQKLIARRAAGQQADLSKGPTFVEERGEDTRALLTGM